MLLRICRFIGPCMYLNYRKKNFFLCEFSTFIPIMVGLGNLAFQVCLKGPFIGNSIAHRKLQFQLILPSQRSSWKPNSGHAATTTPSQPSPPLPRPPPPRNNPPPSTPPAPAPSPSTILPPRNLRRSSSFTSTPSLPPYPPLTQTQPILPYPSYL